MNAAVERKTGVPPVDELVLQEELDDHPAKILRHHVEVPEGDMHELAGLTKAAFQDDAVPVWSTTEKIPPDRTSTRLNSRHDV
jgi:hypothetical protein